MSSKYSFYKQNHYFRIIATACKVLKYYLGFISKYCITEVTALVQAGVEVKYLC